MANFQYQPLPAARMPIRLLILHPGEFSDPIRAALQHTSIPIGDKYNRYRLKDDEEQGIPCPKYEALSYAWGSTDNPKPISMDRQGEDANVVLVTENLDIALRHLRDPIDSRLLWVDAVCIDQNNIPERNAQVSLMGNVYARASRVVVWLGPARDNSDRAIEFLDSLGRRSSADLIKPGLEPTILARGEQDLTNVDTPILFSAGDEDAIGHLFSRPWFERLWARQEIAMSRQAILQCGTMTLDWLRFSSAVAAITRKPGTNPNLREKSRLPCGAVDSINWEYTYEHVRFNFGALKCTDARDCIYAIQGLLDAGEANLGLTPDYAIEAGQLFTDVCVRMTERHFVTGFLRSCDISARLLPNLPTWVPDWSTPLNINTQVATPWSACAWVSSQAKFLGSRVLRVTGIQVSQVERICHFEPKRTKFGDLFDPLEKFFGTSDETVAVEPHILRDGKWPDDCFRVLCMDIFEDSYLPVRPMLSNPTQIKKELLSFRQADGTWDWDQCYLAGSPAVKQYLGSFRRNTIGRALFTTTDGHIGLAPRDTRAGDIVCVVLGCRAPMILRRDLSDKTKWQVVGPSQLQGFMHGEAIYHTLPDHYRPVWHYSGSGEIDRRLTGIVDLRTQEVKTDPAEILAEVGIRPTRYQKEPHVLEVAPEVLREAGVDLQEFDLI